MERLDRKAFQFSFISERNCYAAEDHFFLMMPHDRLQHVVCKNTHDLLDNGLTCPILSSAQSSLPRSPSIDISSEPVCSFRVGG